MTATDIYAVLEARLMEKELENRLLRRAARLIHDRAWMVSGSMEMAETDAFLKSIGLEVWTWPIERRAA